MTTAAIIGLGAVFQVNDGASSPTAWHTLGEVTSITPPNLSVDQIDVTHMASPNRTREFISGLTDPGEMTVEMNHVPGSETDAFIIAWRTAGDTRSCRIQWPPSGTPVDTFPAFVSGYEPTLVADDKLSSTLTLKVAGAVVRT